MRLLLLFLVGTLVLLAAPVSAQASFSFAGTLSAPGEHADDARVAMAPNGDAVFVWVRDDLNTACGLYACRRIAVRARSAAGELGPVQTISPPDGNAIYPHVAVDAQGNAVITWGFSDSVLPSDECCSIVQVRAVSAAGVLSPIKTLSDPTKNALEADVEVDSNGNAVFGWTLTDSAAGTPRVQARARSVAGALSPVQRVSPAGQNAYEGGLGLDASGNAVFVWTLAESGNNRVQTRTRSASGALSPIESVSALGQYASLSKVAVAPDGDAVFAWELQYGTTECDGERCVRLMARGRSAAGTFSVVQPISDPTGYSSSVESAVEVDSDGDAVFKWKQRDDTTQCFGQPCARIRARARSAAGSLSQTQILSASGQGADQSALSVDSSGNAVFVWRREDGTTGCGGGYSCRRIQARARSASGALSPVQTLSGPGQHAYSPAVAVDPDGGFDPNVADAAAGWQRYDGSGPTRIQAAVQFAPPPS